MGFFDDLVDAINPVKIFDRGVKAVKKIGKGIKREGDKWLKGRKRAFRTTGAVLKEMTKGKNWKVGAKKAGKILQEPMKYIQRHDPLAKKMGKWGGFSPISLGAGAFLGPAAGWGYMSDLTQNKEKQKKLREGDASTWIDTSMAGVSLIPIPGSASKGVSSAGKAIGRGLGSAAKVIR